MDSIIQVLQSVITIKDFTQHFQKILIIDMSLVFGVKKLMSEETFSTIKNYYRRISLTSHTLVKWDAVIAYLTVNPKEKICLFNN